MHTLLDLPGNIPTFIALHQGSPAVSWPFLPHYFTTHV